MKFWHARHAFDIHAVSRSLLSPVFPPFSLSFSLSSLSLSLLLSLSWPTKTANVMPLTGEPLSDALSGNLYANGVGHSDETPGFAIVNGTY